MNDTWRYNLIGSAEWIIDEKFNANVEDDMIAKLDNDDCSLSEGPDIHAALEKLPERWREIVWMHYFEGKSLSQIGAIKGYTKPYAWQELQKALKMLKEIMNESI